ncbi:hypothetical protein ACFWVP_30645 [Streptomyces sp. NPDC058637]|uniref:hypothetical protein n=1 Tax=Streptomyces sp. NPDC058637 TaxID=3346569 RepID=UPI00365FD5DF
MPEKQSCLSYDGNENPSGLAVPPGLQAVVDAQIEAIAAALSQTLNLNTSLNEEVDPWLHRLLREAAPLVHEVEKLGALLVAGALAAGWSEEQVAYSMDRPKGDVKHWQSQDAKAAMTAAAGEELGDDWNMASVEAYLRASAAVENKKSLRSRAYRLMCLLLLHDTPSYAADRLTWVDDKTRRCIKNGWFLQARRAASSTNATASESTTPPKLPAQEKGPEAPKIHSA